MGSLFSKIDPLKFLGANSFLAKASGSGPLAGTGFQKFVDPHGYAAGKTYDDRLDAPAGYVAAARPFAGQTPTLAAAQSGYTTPGMDPSIKAGVGGSMVPPPSPGAAANNQAAWMQNSNASYINAARSAAQGGWGSNGY